MEAFDEADEQAYISLIKMILSEAQVSGAINRLYAYIDLKEPVFVIHATISLAGRPTKIVDFANIQPLRGGGYVF